MNLEDILIDLFGWSYRDINAFLRLHRLACLLDVADEIAKEVAEVGLSTTNINSYMYILMERIFNELCERVKEDLGEELINEARLKFSPYTNYFDSSTGYDSIDCFDEETTLEEIIDEFREELLEKYKNWEIECVG